MGTELEINWALLNFVFSKYSHLGYTKTCVPWMVSKEAIAATFNGTNNAPFKDLHVVGSAEQSFIQLMLDGKLIPGAYSALTPCFRDEEVLDETHQNYFAKVELFSYLQDYWDDRSILMSTITDAIQVMTELTKSNISVVKTDEGYDLELNGVEVGSYGIRKYKNFRWVYGTGLAEPRFTYATKLKM